MVESGTRLGIDFGTSHTAAILAYPGGRSRTLLFDGAPLLRSAVYADPGGDLLVGTDAIRRSGVDPTRYEPHPKQRIDETTLLLGDREYTVAEVISAVLRRVATEVGRVAGGLPDDVVLTCPAAWGARRRQVLTDATRMAGLPAVRLVPEPVAAAAYFSRVLGHRLGPSQALTVADFGGGTFDVAVVESQGAAFTVLATGGLADVGGVDLDAAIVEHVSRSWGTRHAGVWERLRHPTTTEDRRARRLLWDDARTAKESLSRTAQAPIFVAAVGEETHINREEFESLVTPLLDRVVAETSRVIAEARRDRAQLAGVFLVGGSTRVPLFGQLLHRALGIAPTVLEQPEVAVVEGAVLLDQLDRGAAMNQPAVPVSPPPTPTPWPAQPQSPAAPPPHAAFHQPAPAPAAHPAPTAAPPMSPPLPAPAPYPAPMAAPMSPPPITPPPSPVPGRRSGKGALVALITFVVLLALGGGGLYEIYQNTNLFGNKHVNVMSEELQHLAGKFDSALVSCQKVDVKSDELLSDTAWKDIVNPTPKGLKEIAWCRASAETHTEYTAEFMLFMLFDEKLNDDKDYVYNWSQAMIEKYDMKVNPKLGEEYWSSDPAWGYWSTYTRGESFHKVAAVSSGDVGGDVTKLTTLFTERIQGG